MAGSRLLTWQEKHAHVLAYLALGYGSKGAYLREHGVKSWQIHRWRAQVYAGSLEQGLAPRGGVMNSAEENREITRLVRLNQELEQRVGERERQHREEVAAKDAELAQQRAAVDALGKAIALLHHHSESADGTTGP